MDVELYNEIVQTAAKVYGYCKKPIQTATKEDIIYHYQEGCNRDKVPLAFDRKKLMEQKDELVEALVKVGEAVGDRKR